MLPITLRAVLVGTVESYNDPVPDPESIDGFADGFHDPGRVGDGDDVVSDREGVGIVEDSDVPVVEREGFDTDEALVFRRHRDGFLARGDAVGRVAFGETVDGVLLVGRHGGSGFSKAISKDGRWKVDRGIV
jgi:hypothetical protein